MGGIAPRALQVSFKTQMQGITHEDYKFTFDGVEQDPVMHFQRLYGIYGTSVLCDLEMLSCSLYQENSKNLSFPHFYCCDDGITILEVKKYGKIQFHRTFMLFKPFPKLSYIFNVHFFFKRFNITRIGFQDSCSGDSGSPLWVFQVTATFSSITIEQD